MSEQAKSTPPTVRVERLFLRFSLAQRWEHVLLIVFFTVLLLTGLPQKYRHLEWSQFVLSTPERLATIRQIHHIAALLLTLEAVYHLGKAVYLIIKRRLPADMLVTMQDVHHAWQMLKYLLFLSKEKPVRFERMVYFALAKELISVNEAAYFSGMNSWQFRGNMNQLV